MLREKQSKKDIIILIIVVCIAIILLTGDNGKRLWAQLIGPFDRRPEIGFLEFARNPDRAAEYRKDLCAWLTREALRNPSIVSTSARDQACRNIE